MFYVKVSAGLQKDCPFIDKETGMEVVLTAELAESMDVSTFEEYAYKVSQYLQVLDTRLFSEGLHVLGGPPSPSKTEQYLEAYYSEDISPEVITAISKLATDSGVTSEYLSPIVNER